MKRIQSLVYSSLAIILIIATVFFSNGLINQNQAEASSPQTLTGYAWSETIGWIKFDTTSPVTLDPVTGNLSGYAWSENVGWVKFGGFGSGFPVGNTTQSKDAKISGNNVVGWFRVCAGMDDLGAPPPDQTLPNNNCTGSSRADGWDGWVSLKGRTTPGNINYGVTLTGSDTDCDGNQVPGANFMTGYAWGSDVVGWLDMCRVGLKSNYPLPNPILNIDLTAGVGCDYDAILTWNDENNIPPGNIVTYTLQRTIPLPVKDLTPVNGQATDTGLDQNTTYTYKLTATNETGSVSVTKSTTTPSTCSNPPIIGSFVGVPPVVPSGTTCSLQYAGIQYVDVSLPTDSCVITGPGVNYTLATTTDGSKQSGPINSTSRYTITCVNAAGSASLQTQCSIKPAFNEF